MQLKKHPEPTRPYMICLPPQTHLSLGKAVSQHSSTQLSRVGEQIFFLKGNQDGVSHQDWVSQYPPHINFSMFYLGFWEKGTEGSGTLVKFLFFPYRMKSDLEQIWQTSSIF